MNSRRSDKVTLTNIRCRDCNDGKVRLIYLEIRLFYSNRIVEIQLWKLKKLFGAISCHYIVSLVSYAELTLSSNHEAWWLSDRKVAPSGQCKVKMNIS